MTLQVHRHAGWNAHCAMSFEEGVDCDHAHVPRLESETHAFSMRVSDGVATVYVYARDGRRQRFEDYVDAFVVPYVAEDGAPSGAAFREAVEAFMLAKGWL